MVSLSDVASPEKGAIISGPFGSNIGKRFFVDDGVPVIRGNNLADPDVKFTDEGFVFLTDEKAAALKCWAVPDDLVFTAAGSLGQVGLIPRHGRYHRYVISNKQLRIRLDKTKIVPDFAYYYFAAPDMRAYVASQNKGSSVPLITLAVLRSLPIRQPPLSNQRKIAAILSAYDNLIEKNNRRIKVFEEMAERIYREWFVDFRYPGHENVSMVDSELGPIPQGWCVMRLGKAVEFVYGKALKADARRDGSVTVFGSGGAIGRHDEALAEGPGIIVGRKGNVGSVYWSDGPFFAIDTTYWVRSRLPLTYCYYALREMDFLDSHAAVPGLSREQAYSLLLLVPDPNIGAMFNGFTLELFAMRRWLADSIGNLRATRDLLLPRLISGEIDVTGLNIAVPDAAT